jgi:uncharacterized protein YbaA (DUF1428 family)
VAQRRASYDGSSCLERYDRSHSTSKEPDMYINGFVVAVPEGNKDEYRASAEKFWDIAKEYGALTQVEGWESDINDGKVTDFRRAVKAESGEKIVFSWVTWPDKRTADASHEKMMADPRMKSMSMPFDGKRMIFGGFESLVVKGER